jgi:hypothetical protein
MGSHSGSPWGSSRRGCFSTASVSAEGLEHPEGVGVGWPRFLRLWLELVAQEEVLCPKDLHCLQNRGNDSYNTFWVMVTPLGKEMLIVAGKSANKSVSTSTLAYDNRDIEDVGVSKWSGFPITLATRFITFVCELVSLRKKYHQWINNW